MLSIQKYRGEHLQQETAFYSSCTFAILLLCFPPSTVGSILELSLHHNHLITDSVDIMVSVISQIETEHHDAIHDAQMDYYGTRLATCSSDKTIRIFNTSSGSNTLEATLEGHEQ